MEHAASAMDGMNGRAAPAASPVASAYLSWAIGLIAGALAAITVLLFQINGDLREMRGEFRAGQAAMREDIADLRLGQQALRDDVSALHAGQRALRDEVGALRAELRELAARS